MAYFKLIRNIMIRFRCPSAQCTRRLIVSLLDACVDPRSTSLVYLVAVYRSVFNPVICCVQYGATFNRSTISVCGGDNIAKFFQTVNEWQSWMKSLNEQSRWESQFLRGRRMIWNLKNITLHVLSACKYCSLTVVTFRKILVTIGQKFSN